MTNTAQKLDSEIIAEAILKMLKEKDPLFAMQESEYKMKLMMQYDYYMKTQLVNMLKDENKLEYERIGMENEEAQIAFLKKHVENLNDVILDLNRAYLELYRDIVKSL